MTILDILLFVGDSEFALGLDTYTQTVISTANTQLYLLDSKNIDRFITKKYTNTLDIIRANVLQKLKCRRKLRIAGYDIELFSVMIDALEQLNPKSSLFADSTEKQKPNPKEQLIQEQLFTKTSNLNLLVDLYLANKAQLVQHHVPDAVYYKTKSVQKARKRMMERLRKYEATHTEVSPNVRLDRAKRLTRFFTLTIISIV